MQNSYHFTIDDYEKSTKEFEKYVSAIPKKVPLKLTKTNTISSLMKDFIQKSEFNDTEELCILSNIFSTLNQWACPGRPMVNSEKLISLSIRHDELFKQHLEILAKIDQINLQIEVKTAETNGFSSVSELEEVVLMLKNKLARVDKGKDGEKIVLQLQELTNLIPHVKKIEALVEKVEVLEREKEILLEYIQETKQNYEILIKKV